VIYDSLMGRQLDEYRLETLLGQGGMARVYRGRDVRLNRQVAIKVIDKPFRADQDYTHRFEQEAQAIAQLEHPHIVRLYRYGESNGLLYMVLQYIERLRLDQLLATYRQDNTFIERPEAARIIREIGSALDYAHGRGVIHRDVKPSNIILNPHGQAILVDFGLALLTDRGTRGEVFGTPDYMAPEQVRSSSSVVPQSDLYALGVILYEMFTGRLPFEAEEPLDVALLHMTEPPPPPREFRPNLHPHLEGVILKALAKEPGARYPSGMALANALDRALKIAAPAPPDLPPPTLSHLSIPERVRVERPLPPELVETQAAPRFQSRENGQPRMAPAPAAPPAGPKWAVIGLGLGLLLLAGVFAATLWLTQSLLQPSPRETVNAMPSPPLPATLPPANSPQLVADTGQNFSIASGGVWRYLWSEHDENDFEPMEFDERKYGACWYTDEDEDYVRICPDSGHPGDDADIAWQWTSTFSGRIGVVVSARKIDAGGDGVTLLASLNGQAIEGLRLGPADTQGVAEKPLFETEVNEGDLLMFIMKKNDRVEYDHTAFQVQIYRQ